MSGSRKFRGKVPKEKGLGTIFAILIVLWLRGLIGHLAGGLIHLLLVPP
jgi:hypothetical protein